MLAVGPEHSIMQRREFITLFGGAALWPLAAHTQEPRRTAKPVCIGVLASFHLPPMRRFSQKLKELGYVEGETLRLEYRFAEGHDDRYANLAGELVGLPVDLILTTGTPAAIAAKRATSTIPIVMASIGDAVGTGVVSSLAHPGGNVTGFSALNVELEGKRLEILKEVMPHLSRVGMLANAANPLFDVSLKNLQPTAAIFGLSLDIVEIRSIVELDAALLKLVQAHPEAVLIAADSVLLYSRRQ